MISEATILKQVKGNKKGYTLKNISELTGTNIAEFTGTPKAALHIKKTGRFTATLTLAHAFYTDVTLTGAEFTIERVKAPAFAFNALTTSYEIDKSIGTADLLKQIPFDSETKRGYTLKSIRMPASYGFIGGVAPNLQMEIIKAGSFTVDIVLEKAHHEDAEITGARFSISKGSTLPDFGFTKMVTRYAYKKVLKKAAVLKQIANAYRNGFTIKSIANVSDTSIAEVTGADFDIKIKGVGSFTADIILHSPTNFNGEVKITGAMFQIDKGVIPSLSYAKLTLPYISGMTIRNSDILPQFIGVSEQGLSLRINALSADINAFLNGTTGIISIRKKGTFKIRIVLQNSQLYQGEKYIWINIIVGDSYKFSFAPLKVPYNVNNNVITSTEILRQIPTATAKGYAIKSISNISDAAVASISGTGASSQINIKKVGTFTATIVLEKSGASDETITKASFEIGKAPAPEDLVFHKLVRNYTAHQKSFTITASELLKQIPNAASAGYTLKSLTVSDASLATVSGTKPNFIITTSGHGRFTARMVLESERFEDLTFPAAVFEINGLPAGTPFNFNTLTTAFAANKVISTSEILARIPGASAAGYTLSWIEIVNTHIVELSGTPPNIQIKVKQAGTTTAKIVLKKGDEQSVIRRATIQITKANPPVTFSFSDFHQAYDGNQYRVITASDIFAEITGAPSSYGYRIKSIAAISDNKVAELTGAGKMNIGIKTEGTFTAKITLEGSTQYKDVTIDASFDVFPVMVTINLIHGISKEKYQVTGLKTELSGITVLKIPSKIGDKEITTIGTKAFQNNKNITQVKIPHGITHISDEAFRSCTNLVSVDIPDSVTTMNARVFLYCTNLRNVSIPPRLTQFLDALFGDCSNLTNITIPIKVTEIGSWVFYGCTSLTNITLPIKVGYIRESAFEGCTSLTIKVLQTDPSKIKFRKISGSLTTSDNKAFKGVKAIKVPSASEAAYKAAPIWKDYAGIISGY